ncbi:MAG: phytanoyl-CoA dioxygenase family protein [Planctomycetota bacterium]|jgi:hypothetical protein|nr:phytanoyl-CoA dioxygenase family protein [Planctomycetota bacterium]
MITAEQLCSYHENGYLIIEDAIEPDSLPALQQAYEEAIGRALELGHAARDPETGFLNGHRFQNPHHPDLAKPALLDSLVAEPVMQFCRGLAGPTLAFYGLAAFAMQPEFDYLGQWHRDAYAAWGKDSETERAVREIHSWPCTQVLLAIEDDACFWVVPGSHNRPNTEEEERKFEEGETGWEEIFPGAIQTRLKAGTAVPFDARSIHRGLKRPGTSRRSIFFVYGPPRELKHTGVTAWAKDPAYRNPEYLASLPSALRTAMELTQAYVSP